MSEDSRVVDLEYPRGDGKRKYEETEYAAPPTRRTTGFSPPIIDAGSTNSNGREGNGPANVASLYNTAPSPQIKDEFELAKQKAQELAARFMAKANHAPDGQAKRAKLDEPSSAVDNGSSLADGSSQSQSFGSLQQGGISSTQTTGTYYGFQSTSRKMEIPLDKVGLIIGKGGETIKYLQYQSGAKMQVIQNQEIGANPLTRFVELSGTPEQLKRAEQLVNDVIKGAEASGSGNVPPGSEQVQMKVANDKVGLIIGRGGDTIKNLQSRSGARIQIIPLHLPPGDTSTERNVHITGTKSQIEHAQQLINEVINNEKRLRGPPLPGGYIQQGYRGTQPPPPRWGPPGPPPMQQPGYGYQQSASYAGPPQQYASQSYGGYPQQPSSGYSSGQPPQSAPYDYYGQQGHSAGGSTNDSYSYGQPQGGSYGQGVSYGQGYPQQSYGQYGQDSYAPQGQSQQGYPQPVNPSQGYDQQSYNNPGYGPPGAPQPSPLQTQQQDGSASQPPAAARQGYAQGESMPSQQGYSQQTLAPSNYQQSVQQSPYGSQGASNPTYSHQVDTPQTYAQQGASNAAGYGQAPYATPDGQGGSSYGQQGAAPASYAQAPTSQANYGQQTGSSQPSYSQHAAQLTYPQQGVAPPAGYGQQGAATQDYSQSTYSQQGLTPPAVYGQQGATTQDYSQTSSQSGYPQQQDTSKSTYAQ
eukprot:TRINITY_DN13304_c0_g1_i3.p1 TRINITY_DN13304_c0_g1~~TRINITY_DN13304_c0_g1_i3.p1  ORF type:complete len:695 (+),score=149.34 TRINITY_DN13304_c0_g1_i3:207-2291(+)